MRSPRRAAALAVLAFVAVGALAAGCGIPTDDHPRLLAADTATTVGAPSSAPADSANSVAIYLTRGEAPTRLVSVRRGLDGTPTPERALEALLAGPTQEDLDDGYLSNFPVPSQLEGPPTFSDGLLTIDIDQGLFGSGNVAVGAFAQVVFTVTDLPDFQVDQIRFRSGGTAINAFTPDGVKEVVTRADYADLDPKLK